MFFQSYIARTYATFTLFTTLLLLVFLAGVDVALSSSSSSTITSTTNNEITSPFKIVIDGGSTGSRLHIFELKQDPQTSKTYIERRGSTKVNIPLSDFADEYHHNNNAAYHLLPLFKFASEVIPSQYHTTTQVSLQATAGMRLVDLHNQNGLYDVIHEKLSNHADFVFDSFRRSDVKTLDGVLEGLYGVIAVNYLKGVVDVNLKYNENRENNMDQNEIIYDDENGSTRSDEEQICRNNTPFGALDMGGASMQIVYLPNNQPSKSENQASTEATCPNTELQEEKLPSHEFYSTSYLSYGSDQFRERLWDLWIVETQQGKRKEIKMDYSNDDPSGKKVIANPCSFTGHETEWNGYTLYGIGNAKECSNEINRLIPHHERVDHSIENDDEYIVGGIQHPEIHGEFYAMSLFFFVMDCVREYTQDEIITKEWPNPTLHELNLAVESFCSKHWDDDIMNFHGLDVHQFTRGHRLADRCFESVYIIALLRDGFGFDVHSRDITYSFLVDDSEVEWSLGMAVSLYADDGMHVDPSNLTSPNGNSHNSEENSTDYHDQKNNKDEEKSNGEQKSDNDEDLLNEMIGNGSILSDSSPI